MPNFTWQNTSPILFSAMESATTLVGAFMQRRADRIVADEAENRARQNAADRRVQNRIVLSAARTRGLVGTDDANLDILMQLAGQAAVSVERIRENGALSAWYYRNIGDQAVYGAGAAGMQALGRGLLRADERGLRWDFGSGVPDPIRLAPVPRSPVPLPGPVHGPSVQLPATGGPTIIDPGVIA